MVTRTLFAAAMAALVPAIAAGDVFAHYMANDLPDAKYKSDVEAAARMGFAAFAYNLNAASLNDANGWADRGTQRLFDAAAEAGFKVFISVDLDNADDADRDGFADYLNKYMAHSAYYKTNDKPMLSTFSTGRTSADSWPGFLSRLNSGNDIYFIPETDNNEGYYTEPAGAASFWDSWAPVVDGVFSWNTAWAMHGNPNVSVSQFDEPHAAEARRRGKDYMISMSSHQYKHWMSHGNNWYRVGEVGMPQRMTEVLSMDPRPEFVEVISWNDSGESHYIGVVNEEGLLEEFKEYANEERYSHVAWQPLYRSFNDAFARGVDARGMRPEDGKSYVGAMWYRSVTTDAQCSDRPDGADDAKDAVNWAVVVDEGIDNAYVQVYSNGENLSGPVKLHAGLNYGSVPGLMPGEQHIEVVETDDLENGNWDYIHQKTGDVEVANDGGLCNYNYLVYGLE